MAPAVTVAIPTYNNPGLLLQTLDTVFAQTFTDFEVVVVNDGSTDDTAGRLAPLAGRIRLVNQPNAGIGAARNRAIDEARGRYVALLDHDDLWHPDKLAEQVRFMERHPSCAGCSVPWSYSTSPDRCVFNLAKVRAADGTIHRPLRHLAHGDVFLISSSILFERQRARGLRYATERKCIEDVPFQVGLFGRGDFGIAGDRILMVYRWHDSNYSSQAAFHYNGIRMLRSIEKTPDIAAAGPSDVAMFFSHIGRAAAVRQLCAGEHWKGIRTYLREFPHQVRDGRLKFLATFPLLSLAPRSVIERRFPSSTRVVADAPQPAANQPIGGIP